MTVGASLVVVEVVVVVVVVAVVVAVVVVVKVVVVVVVIVGEEPSHVNVMSGNVQSHVISCQPFMGLTVVK